MVSLGLNRWHIGYVVVLVLTDHLEEGVSSERALLIFVPCIGEMPVSKS